VLLSDRDIKEQISAKRVAIEPFDPAMVQPSSVDVRLDRFFRVFENHKYSEIDPSVEQPELTRELEVAPDEHFILHPGEFVLASTYEVITLPDDIAGRLEGKSSLGRLGLLTHSTAGFIDPGFSGHITLELSNVANLPVKLFPQTLIPCRASLWFGRLWFPLSRSARTYTEQVLAQLPQEQDSVVHIRSLLSRIAPRMSTSRER
jgi:dCTP deaminase